jgi:hypothetical protein
MLLCNHVVHRENDFLNDGRNFLYSALHYSLNLASKSSVESDLFALPAIGNWAHSDTGLTLIKAAGHYYQRIHDLSDAQNPQWREFRAYYDFPYKTRRALSNVAIAGAGTGAVQWLNIRRPLGPYLLLFAALAVGWYVARSGGFASTPFGRPETSIMLTLPLLFSGIVFSALLSSGDRSQE